jgi:hypothetical protein
MLRRPILKTVVAGALSLLVLGAVAQQSVTLLNLHDCTPNRR